MGGKVEVRGFENVIANMRQLPGNVKIQLIESTNLAADVLEKAVRKEAGLTDHSLKALAALGHPYSTKKGMDSGPHADELVHVQSGNLTKHIKRVAEVTDASAVAAAGVLESDVPYIKYLINGTTKMRPRDFLGHTWLAVRAVVVAIVKNGLTRSTSRKGNVRRSA